MNCQSSEEYPVPRVERINRKYALLLLEDYAGDISEDTAVHQYLFQYLMQDDSLIEFKKTLEKIAIVEMHHMELLGKTIKLLGVMPAFGCVNKDNGYKAWSSTNINYEIDIKSIILNNIIYEENAIRKYKYHYSVINDKYVRNLIDRIIKDELVHIKIFNYFYDKLVQNG